MPSPLRILSATSDAGGNDVISSSTKPATRSDSSTLQMNDRWWDATDEQWWRWNGTYWLSEQKHILRSGGPYSASTQPNEVALHPNMNFWLLRFDAVVVPSANHDSTNNYTIRLRQLGSNSANAVVEASFTTSNAAAAARATYSYAFADTNKFRDMTALSAVGFDIDFVKNTLIAAAIVASATLQYRLAKP